MAEERAQFAGDSHRALAARLRQLRESGSRYRRSRRWMGKRLADELGREIPYSEARVGDFERESNVHLPSRDIILAYATIFGRNDPNASPGVPVNRDEQSKINELGKELVGLLEAAELELAGASEPAKRAASTPEPTTTAAGQAEVGRLEPILAALRRNPRRVVPAAVVALVAVAVVILRLAVANDDDVGSNHPVGPAITQGSQASDIEPPTGTRHVCPDTDDMTVFRQPQGEHLGKLLPGDTFFVERYQAGRFGPYTYAYGLANGRVNQNGYVVTSFLCGS